MTLRPRAAATTAVLALLALAMSTTAFAQNPAPAIRPAQVPVTEKPAAMPAPAAAPAPAAVTPPAAKGVAVGEPAPSGKREAPSASGGEESGLAAVYSDKLHGRKTASGKRYDRNALTAAHKTLPFGTKVRVTNIKNKKSVELTINDRGPVQVERILDISPRAAKALGIHRLGMGDVTMVVVGRGKS